MVFPMRMAACAALVTMLFCAAPPIAAQERGGVIRVALSAEPPTLDPMGSSAALTSIVTQHIAETLYAFDKSGSPAPLLAAAMPETSSDGLTHTIRLRTQVPFHDGQVMTSRDVVASLARWMKVTTNGKTFAAVMAEIQAPDDATVRIRMNQKFAPFTQYLASLVAAAVVLPAGSTDAQFRKPVGTGPYRLKEHRTDQYIQLVRFDEYRFNAGVPNGQAGARKQYADEIRFVPVPDASTRLEAALAGQFDYIDAIPAESAERLRGQRNVEPLKVLYGWPVMSLNRTKGLFSNLDARRAVIASLDMQELMSGYGQGNYVVNGSIYPVGSAWYRKDGTEKYNARNPKQAQQLLKQANYDGKPVRFLTSRQNEDHFRLAQVAAESMKSAGFKVNLEVLDWATFTQRRVNPELFDALIVVFPFYPDPSLITTLGGNLGWTTPTRAAAMHLFNTELDPARRLQRWGDFQRLIFAEVPFIKLGDVYNLNAKSPRLKGIEPVAFPYFWNAYLQR